jgi:hypothetical protein
MRLGMHDYVKASAAGWFNWIFRMFTARLYARIAASRPDGMPVEQIRQSYRRPLNHGARQMTVVIHGHQVQPCLGGRHVTQRLKRNKNSVGLDGRGVLGRL